MTRRQLLKKLNRLLLQLKKLTFNAYIQAVMELSHYIADGGEFIWNESGAAEKKIMNFLEVLEGKVNTLLTNGCSDFYQIGLEDAQKEVEKALKGRRQISEKRNVKRLNREAEDQRRIQATAGHAQSVSYRGGALNNLSNRVWSFKDNARKEIEAIVQQGIRNGKGVNAVKDDVRQFLNTGKNGEMAQPGRGVYKSLEKNCERLIRTETMAAYRSAEIDSYQTDDSVIGFEIRLSGNHMTTNGNKEPKEIHDICDQCQGKYPKSFYWTGWHPNCRCVLTPITLSPEQFGEYMQAEDEGRVKEYVDSISVKTYPEGFKNYLEANLGKLSRNPPQWLRANPQVLTT